MGCSTPGFPVLHYPLELTQTHVHWVSDAIQPSLSLLPLLLLPSVFPSIRVFSNESVLRIRWPKYWSFSISPFNEYSGLISFRFDWFDLLAVQGTIKSSPASQCESINSSVLSLLSEKAMATHSSTLAWKIPWTEEPSRLQSMGLRRVEHDWSDLAAAAAAAFFYGQLSHPYVTTGKAIALIRQTFVS